MASRGLGVGRPYECGRICRSDTENTERRKEKEKNHLYVSKTLWMITYIRNNAQHIILSRAKHSAVFHPISPDI
jgi:hypothetical protein